MISLLNCLSGRQNNLPPHIPTSNFATYNVYLVAILEISAQRKNKNTGNSLIVV